MTNKVNDANHPNALHFKKICQTIFFLSLFVGFMVFIKFYSPAASIFSLRSNLFASLLMGIISGAFVFILGTQVAAHRFMPERLKSKRVNHDDFYDHQKPPVNSESSLRQDWYNDISNPASPVYKAAQDSLHH